MGGKCFKKQLNISGQCNGLISSMVWSLFGRGTYLIVYSFMSRILIRYSGVEMGYSWKEDCYSTNPLKNKQTNKQKKTQIAKTMETIT